MKVTLDIPDELADGYAAATGFTAGDREAHCQTALATHVKNTAARGMLIGARNKINADVSAAKVDVVATASAVKA